MSCNVLAGREDDRVGNLDVDLGETPGRRVVVEPSTVAFDECLVERAESFAVGPGEDRVAVFEEKAASFGVLLRPAEVQLDGRENASVRVGVVLVENCDLLILIVGDRVVQEGGEDAVLGAEVVVDAAVADAALDAERGDADGVEARCGGDRRRSVEHALARGRGSVGRRHAGAGAWGRSPMS